MKTAIPYYRVSTERQGESGLGLEAQKKSVQDFARSRNFTIGQEFTEVESGRNIKRPVLREALQACEKENGVLLIAKLDRLARNVAFISKLMEAKVEFVAVDNPNANKLIVHIMAVFAEFERDQISIRTKDALKAAKKRGMELGKNGKLVLSKENKIAANNFAKKMQPVIQALNNEGFITVRAITDVLNTRKIMPYSGDSAKWHPSSVYTLLKRIATIEEINQNFI